MQAQYDEIYNELCLEFEEIENASKLEDTTSEQENIYQTTSYSQILEELDNVDDSEVEELNLLEEMNIAGSFVIPMLQKNKTDFKYHAIIEMSKDKSRVFGGAVHEILHALEATHEIKNGRIEGKTGFIREDDNDENRLFSECIHNIILQKRIFKQLREMGYEITGYNDYNLKMLPEVETFFTQFESAILDSRCEPTLDKLFNIVGKENFSKIVQYQNSSKKVTQEQMLELISGMEEHSRQNMANRIGQLTLPQQKDLIGKDTAKAIFESEIEKSQQEVGKEYDE